MAVQDDGMPVVDPALALQVEPDEQPLGELPALRAPAWMVADAPLFEARAEPAANQAPTRAVDGAQANLMTLYLREVRRYGRLPPEQEQQLQADIAAGVDGARETLICHHLGLVIAMARKFSNRGLELLDLVEEGNLGMMVALEKFDFQRGLRFSTYAAWWIRYYLQTALATQVPIVRPPLRAMQRAGRQAWQAWCESHEAGQAAEAGETAPESQAPLVTSVSLHDEDADALMNDAGLQHRDVSELFSEEYDRVRLASLLRDLVAQLPQRQRDIVIARFGLDGQDECTLQELSVERGVTRERIRQVQEAALKTLRTALEEAGVTREVALG
ncbi:sigma-70 family RNA polymerase sigma factor [Schlegelella sp. S2-27]|uniref:Sigma-70 family RNA polymerase sigma factor n=1 Tax=Caldimonas mangrovi TaxID=2944811 RepID=A0ABT0YUI5_9BURK|nr:sigma-70 family RNA polymerase sigma factor [Caldimonas mangrovi]MCM5682406.1 sigma-70 family RNA polymerase sigma factor [Caldimonas mangrovi]